MEQILLAYGLPKETVAAIMMLYRNTKVKARSLDGYRLLRHGNKCTLYLFIICLDYVLRISIDKMKENDFKLTKQRSRMYPTQKITDIDYADDIALLENTPAKAETMLHSLRRHLHSKQ